MDVKLEKNPNSKKAESTRKFFGKYPRHKFDKSVRQMEKLSGEKNIKKIPVKILKNKSFMKKETILYTSM